MNISSTRLWAVITSLVKAIGQDRIMAFAGNAAFTSILALFPFLIFMVALASFLGGADLAQEIVNRGFAMLPHEVMETLSPVVKETIGQSQGDLLTFGILGTLWAASSGVESMRDALNIAHRLKEDRPFWWLRLQGLLFIIAGSFVFLLLAALLIAAPIAIEWMMDHMPFDPSILLPIQLARLVISLGLLVGIFLALFRILPNTSYRLKSLLPGAVLSAVLWMAIASLFSYYLSNFGSYNVTYGSLGGIIATLAFFQLSAAVTLIGAELNATLHAIDGEEKALTPEAKRSLSPTGMLNRHRISTSNAS